jgi:hypothetical protein
MTKTKVVAIPERLRCWLCGIKRDAGGFQLAGRPVCETCWSAAATRWSWNGLKFNVFTHRSRRS